MPRLHFVLDLKNDPALIREYEDWHRPGRIWPEIPRWLRESGIVELEIFRCGDRLVMAMEVSEEFKAEGYAARAAAEPRVREWEELMSRFQKALPFARAGEKWVPLQRLFSLSETLAAQERGP